jgi:hypothetical protein
MLDVQYDAKVPAQPSPAVIFHIIFMNMAGGLTESIPA